MAISELGRLGKQDREEYLWKVFKEAEDFRQQKEVKILEVFRFVRDLADDASHYKAKMRHPYAFAAAEALKSSIYPIMFSADPAIQIVDPNPNNHPRNQITEKIISSFLKNPLRTNFPIAWDRILNDLVWFGYCSPWTYFRSQEKVVGPRWRPSEDGATDEFGAPVLEEIYRRIRVYHAPWLEHVDVWDTFIHPDGRRGFTRRDVTGYDLLAQSEGSNPIYDRQRVLQMIMRESQASKKRRDAQNFSGGSESFVNRDQMAAEAGAEPPRHDEIQQAEWGKDILAKPFVLMHMDDGEYHGTYAVASDKSGFMELRFFQGVNYDGYPNRIDVKPIASPQEIYGTSIIEQALPLLKMHTKFYQAAADGAALTVHPMWLGSQQMRNSGSEMVVGPGAVLWAPNSTRGNLDEHVKRLDMPQNWFGALQVVGEIQKGLDLTFAQSDAFRGQFSGGRHTAQETNVVQEFGRSRIEAFHNRTIDQFVVPLVRKWLAMCTEHYTPRDYVEMLGVEGADYIPPAISEIVSTLAYIPKGSITASDTQLRSARWPGILQMLTQTLPFMQVPHVHEAVKRALEDMGVEAVSRIIPSQQDPRMTEYMSKIQEALVNAQGAQAGGSPGGGVPTPGGASPPRSPGDISQLLAQIGGATAPPGPVGNGAEQGFQGGLNVASSNGRF